MPYKNLEEKKKYQKKYQKEWYERNKEKRKKQVRAYNKIYIQKSLEYVNQYKKDKKCCECHEDHPICLDFHHVGDDKEIEISRAIRQGWCLKKIQVEIDKCVIICSNCHRKRNLGWSS